MAGPIFDSHAHYLSRQFDGDRQQLLESLPAAGVAGVVECATDLATSKGAVALAAAWPFVWAAVGIHPESLIESDASTNAEFAGDWKAELAAIAPLLEQNKVVAVGEIGLDYYWVKTPEDRANSRDFFDAQLSLAEELDLPAPEGLPPEERMDLHGAIARLPEKYQDVIKLKYFDGYTIREISEATGMPQGTVSVYLRRAVKELQTLLKEEPVCKKK